MNRRGFLKTSAAISGTILIPERPSAEEKSTFSTSSAISPTTERLPDLAPAHWIWYPSERTLPNSFVLFRRALQLTQRPRRATGWICADSRYRLEINGRRVQWGPAPCDPRWAEADPIDLTELLGVGNNTIGATVLFYGTGDGTWPIGKPGFLFWLELEFENGRVEKVVSDASWQTQLCRAWLPGHYKRWYLRALQEEFDARLFPYGWSSMSGSNSIDASSNTKVRYQEWLPAMVLPGSPNKPAIATGYYEYMLDVGGGPANTELRPRSIPMLKETRVTPSRLVESHRLTWRVDPKDYFDFRVPEPFSAEPLKVDGDGNAPQSIDLDGTHGVTLTWAFGEQVVGWPGFSIEAPAGTVVELLVHEAHRPGGPVLLNTHFDSWTRFTCRAGKNEFETFDFESLRWLQLHIHGPAGRVTVNDVYVRRRSFPLTNQPRIISDEPALQRLFSASLNTLTNSAQETLVDGMARERQQYSGDGGHQMHAVHLAWGEQALPARYLATWSQGMTKDGYFLDCWPAYDRLARLIERQLDLSGWGPILDHGVGFSFDCYSHYLYTGDRKALAEPYPRLLRFAEYLRGNVGRDGLLPVDGFGIPSVWIDHAAYQQQRHKQCAFNLYVAAAMRHALAPICEAFGDDKAADAAKTMGDQLLRGCVRAFWSEPERIFVNNLPWIGEEKQARLCDRSLATCILFDQCPGADIDAAVRVLATCPSEMGFSYPCNAGWRLWALAKAGRADMIVKDFRERWATMTSVLENNTLQEDWQAQHDSGQQWSHCAVVPLYMLFHGLVGLRPLNPGFKRYELRPQFGGLNMLEGTAFTVLGPVGFRTEDREITFQLPPGGMPELVLPSEAKVPFERLATPAPNGCRRYRLQPDTTVTLSLKS